MARDHNSRARSGSRKDIGPPGKSSRMLGVLIDDLVVALTLFGDSSRSKVWDRGGMKGVGYQTRVHKDTQ
jgi:hypothetical protein